MTEPPPRWRDPQTLHALQTATYALLIAAAGWFLLKESRLKLSQQEHRRGQFAKRCPCVILAACELRFLSAASWCVNLTSDPAPGFYNPANGL